MVTVTPPPPHTPHPYPLPPPPHPPSAKFLHRVNQGEVSQHHGTHTALPFLAPSAACTGYTAVMLTFPGKERRLRSLATPYQPGLALSSPNLLAKGLLFRSHCPWVVSAEDLAVTLRAVETVVPNGKEQALMLLLPHTLSRIIH